MSRALISIGCNTYDHIRGLTGAEGDATKVAGLLLGTGRYHYRSEIGRRLLSPSTEAVRSAILDLYEHRPTEACFYFAGHAESRDGRLYLKFRDTRDGALLPPTSIT